MNFEKLSRGLLSYTLVLVALAAVACERKPNGAESQSDLGERPAAADPKAVGKEKELVSLLTRTGITSNNVLALVSAYKTLFATNQTQAEQFFARVNSLVKKQAQGVVLELMQAVSRQAVPHHALDLLNQGEVFLNLYPEKDVVQRVNTIRLFGALSDEARQVVVDPLVASEFQTFPQGHISRMMEAILETLAQLSSEASVSATARTLADLIQTFPSSSGDLSYGKMKSALLSGLGTSLLSAKPESLISAKTLDKLNSITASGTRGRESLLISGGCADGLLVHISGPGLISPTTAACSQGSFLKTLSFSNPTSAGTRSVTFSQTDLNGVTTSLNRVFSNDVQPPVITLGAPSRNGVNSSANPVTIAMSVVGGDAARLDFSVTDVLKITTGSADCEVLVSGTEITSRTISLTQCTGDGTVSVRVASDVASDDLGNTSPQSSPSDVIIVANTPPNPPISSSVAITTSTRPTWSWGSATSVGTDTYRVKIDNSDFTSGTTLVQGTSYTTASDLPEGIRTLYVQEQDVAGNWSSTSAISLIIDVTPPATPSVSHTGGGTSNNGSATFNWSSGSGGSGLFRYKLDFGTYVNTTATTHTANSLSNGPHTFFVEEKDDAGNWSASGSASVTVSIPAVTYTIGVNVSGLSGSLTLRNNGSDSLVMNSSGFTEFSVRLLAASNYSVTVNTQPDGQTCSIANGSGIVGSSNITDVNVTCTNNIPLISELVFSPDSVTNMNTDGMGGTDLLQGSEVTFTLTNSGTGASAELLSPIVLGDSSRFSITENNCTGISLAPSSACTIKVRPQSNATGAYSAQLNIGDGIVSSENVSISGAGFNFAIPAAILAFTSYEPIAYTLNGNGGSSPISTSDSHVITVTNTGTAPSGTLLGAAFNGDTAQFTSAENDGCLGVILAPGETCEITNPVVVASSNGRFAASLSVSDGTRTSNPRSLNLLATNFATTAPPASLSIFPASKLDMDVTGPGSPAYGTPVVFSITNNGTQATNELSASIFRDNNPPYLPPYILAISEDNCTGKFLGSGQSCTVKITPSAGAHAIDAGWLMLSETNNGIEKRTKAALSAIASNFAGTSALTLDHARLDFSLSAPVDGTPSRRVTVTNNTGAATGSLNVDAKIQMSGGGYWLWDGGCQGTSLAPGASCYIDVAATAWVDGAYPGFVNITDDQGNIGTVRLTSTAAKFDITSYDLESLGALHSVAPTINTAVSFSSDSGSGAVEMFDISPAPPNVDAHGLVRKRFFPIYEFWNPKSSLEYTINSSQKTVSSRYVARYVKDPETGLRLEVVGKEIDLPCSTNYRDVTDAYLGRAQESGNYQIQLNKVIFDNGRDTVQSATINSNGVSHGDETAHVGIEATENTYTELCPLADSGRRTLFYWLRWKVDPLGDGTFGEWKYPRRATKGKFIVDIEAQTASATPTRSRMDFGQYGTNLALADGALASTSHAVTNNGNDVLSENDYQLSILREAISKDFLPDGTGTSTTTNTVVFNLNAPCSTNFSVNLAYYSPRDDSGFQTPFSYDASVARSVNGGTYTFLEKSPIWRDSQYISYLVNEGTPSGACDNVPTNFKYVLVFRPINWNNEAPYDAPNQQMELDTQWTFFGSSTFEFLSP